LIYKNWWPKSPPVRTVPGQQQEVAEAVQEKQPIRVQVLNGSGVNGLARRFTNFLRTQGFDVVDVGNYKSFDVDRSFVIDRVSNEKKFARKVAEALGIDPSRIQTIIDRGLLLDVTVIIGKDFERLKGFKRPAK